ncbi:hypothetical protein [Alteromonas sp. ASW11-130]|uniref:hypothetical protein n=1 Tax=Alteromonas sp. ASW11-130 TaxID=3015775 RepID=UPI0022422215|nr:hypothetical protein [Alteromonas sp. ASW11-130]MCW8091865.1 hypothetical protein [Alteromonas sp. ASW11-130]
MRKLVIGLIILAFSAYSYAGRSAPTKITKLIVKADYIEIWTDSTGSSCSSSDKWHLVNSHPNYDALYSGFLASKASEKRVDIVGTEKCYGSYEEVSWAYVLM